MMFAAVPDPRIVTAIAYAVVGLGAVGLSLRIWGTHPINRVFTLGAFVTEDGLRWLLDHVAVLFALGMFALASAASRYAYWHAGVARGDGGWPHFFGIIETVFAVWAAGCVTMSVWRLCRKG